MIRIYDARNLRLLPSALAVMLIAVAVGGCAEEPPAETTFIVTETPLEEQWLEAVIANEPESAIAVAKRLVAARDAGAVDPLYVRIAASEDIQEAFLTANSRNASAVSSSSARTASRPSRAKSRVEADT